MNMEFKVTGETKDLTIRTGNALPVKEPVQINISGDIESVPRFIKKRTVINSATSVSGALDISRPDKIQLLKHVEREFPAGTDDEKVIQLSNLQLIDAALAIVLVDKEKQSIELRVDPENAYGAKILGTLEESKELDIFKINSPATFNREQLIKLIRFNRLLFIDYDAHALLLAGFQKFSAKVFMEFEKESDDRGNVANLFRKTVDTKVPLSFELMMPIYKGQPAERFKVDICIESNGNGVVFYFESIELKELLEIRLEEIIAKQLESCQEFPIINL